MSFHTEWVIRSAACELGGCRIKEVLQLFNVKYPLAEAEEAGKWYGAGHLPLERRSFRIIRFNAAQSGVCLRIMRWKQPGFLFFAEKSPWRQSEIKRKTLLSICKVRTTLNKWPPETP